MSTPLHRSRSSAAISLFALAICCTALFACGENQASGPIDVEVAMRAVHDYGKGHSATIAAATSGNPNLDLPDPADPLNTDEVYKAHIAALLAQHDYAQLEKEIATARATKARLQGGIWKVSMFYDGVGEAPFAADGRTVDWATQFLELKKWIAAYPKSAAARIAMAQAYINYGWEGRGVGYANSVSGFGWQKFRQGIQLAEAELLEAAKLKEKCPYWYEAMQQVALAQGWSKEQARALFEEATAFEPTYYHYYRQYAYFLMPKWYGEEGETQELAEEASKKLPERDGAIVYFEIASLLVCPCDEENNDMDSMSWPKIKEGYTTLEKAYGTSRLKVNRFAYMSVVAKDKESARAAFAQIGEDWQKKYWIDLRYFEKAKAWATA